MVAPISVFPDVGNAFFGSYRGARQARLQEQAMRAQMAALRADRERESRARGAFAELVAPPTPELTVDNTAMESRLFGMPRLGAEARGLDPARRSELERTLASSDPSLYSAARQMRAGPEIPEEVYENLGAAVARGDISAEGAVARLEANGVPRQTAASRLGMYVVPPEQDQVNGTVIQTEQGQILINPRTGEPIAEYGRRPRSPNPAGEALAQYLNAQTQSGTAPGPNANSYPSGTVLTAGELYENAGVDLPVGVDPQTSIQVESQPQGRGNFFRPLALGDTSEAAAEAEAAVNRQEGAATSGALMADEFRLSLEMLQDDPGLAGTGREQYANVLTGSGVASLSSRLETLTANIGFEELNAMRMESPTGGALGQVTERELAFLQALQGNLRVGRDPEELAYNLARAGNLNHALVNGYDFDGDGQITEADRIITQARADIAMRSGPFGNPGEVRERVRERRAEMRRGSLGASPTSNRNDGVIRIDRDGNIIGD